MGCQLVDTFFVDPVALGCIDYNACNFSEIANTDDGSCIYSDTIYDCFGNCLNDDDFDGVCDELEINGCTDENAPNFNDQATDDDGSCIECNITVDYILYNSTSNLECNGLIGLIINNQVDYIAYVNNEALNTNYFLEACYGENYIVVEFEDGCVYNDVVNVGATIIYGCTDSTAINYNSLANIDNGSCEYCDQLQTETTTTIESCLGWDATASVSVTGGTTPYSHFWSYDIDYQQPVQLEDNTVNPTVNNANIEFLTEDYYYVHIWDLTLAILLIVFTFQK